MHEGLRRKCASEYDFAGRQCDISLLLGDFQFVARTKQVGALPIAAIVD